MTTATHPATVLKPNRGGILLCEVGDEPVDLVSDGGIHIPQQARPDYTEFEVVAVGPPMMGPTGEVKPLVKVGDRVLAHRKGGRIVKFKDEPELQLVGEEAIWAVIGKERRR